MVKGAIARRYAEAMFDIALKQHAVDRTLEDVEALAEVFNHRTLMYLLSEPKVSAQRKEATLRKFLGDKVQPVSLNLALLLVERGLAEAMPGIAREFKQLVLDYKNQAVADVTTATKVDDAQMTLIKQALERRTGKTILVNAHVEPEILGGVIARVGDQVIDGSVRSRLSSLRHELLNSAASSNIDFLSEEPGADGNVPRAETSRIP